ncbi:MAG TPA: hypothetical protein VGY76_09545 [Solirubrobacteraceae bacterium]|jgi:hypothetical protein|nr:hypothetical protein [Solirubrobacteraceae bacterium]
MIKAKLVAVFSAIVAVLAISVAPALAEYQSAGTETKGTGTSGELVLEGGGGTLTCASTEGEWTILSGGKAATKGNTLSLAIKKFNKCHVKSSSINEAVPSSIKECTLRLTQAAGETKAKGSVAAECQVVVKVLFFTCTLSVPAENGTTNKEILTNKLANSGSNLIVTAEDTGITTEPKGSCFGIEKTTNGKQKATVTAVGVKEV